MPALTNHKTYPSLFYTLIISAFIITALLSLYFFDQYRDRTIAHQYVQSTSETIHTYLTTNPTPEAMAAYITQLLENQPIKNITILDSEGIVLYPQNHTLLSYSSAQETATHHYPQYTINIHYFNKQVLLHLLNHSHQENYYIHAAIILGFILLILIIHHQRNTAIKDDLQSILTPHQHILDQNLPPTLTPEQYLSSIKKIIQHLYTEKERLDGKLQNQSYLYKQEVQVSTSLKKLLRQANHDLRNNISIIDYNLSTIQTNPQDSITQKLLDSAQYGLNNIIAEMDELILSIQDTNSIRISSTPTSILELLNTCLQRQHYLAEQKDIIFSISDYKNQAILPISDSQRLSQIFNHIIKFLIAHSKQTIVNIHFSDYAISHEEAYTKITLSYLNDPLHESYNPEFPIVDKILSRLEGTLSIDHPSNKDTTISLLLKTPYLLHTEDSESVLLIEQNKILLIGEDPLILKSDCTILEKKGIHPIQSTSPQNAIHEYNSTGYTLIIIYLDGHSNTILSNLELIATLQKTSQFTTMNTKIIALSQYNTTEIQDHCFNHHIACLLEHPINYNLLIEKINQINKLKDSNINRYLQNTFQNNVKPTK